jgi:hypothetical protein
MPVQRAGLIGASLAVLALLLLGWRSCAGDEPPAGIPSSTAPTEAAARRERAAEVDADAATSNANARHAAAMRGAVSTLQRYLTALGEDPVRADTYWAGGRPPPHSREADLRSLTGLRALRIESASPVALDVLSPPDAVEIPVELRISIRNAPLRHYRGWYRLRRAGDGWLITSAAIDASPPRR